ncbi:class I tRNA ligase family protein, partial [Candidatus Saccharibacteria bacterium]|nr:class I tRNA ligase family protein [Candidatus Saccharibacteria bacterium]
ISRDRFWATAMPVWKTESGKVKVIGSYAELKELSGVELEDYHRPWIDDVKFEIDGEEYTRIDKVMDSWFEAGSMPFAQFHYPFENKEKFEANFPGDFIVEYIGQVRAWFYYMHAMSVALFGENSFKNVIVTGNVAGNDGRKMSKSYGNYTDPNELMDTFSADSLRFLLLSSPLLSGEDFTLQDKEVGDVARKLSMIWNMYDFFTMYAEVDGWEFDPEKPFSLTPSDVTSPLDKWIISRVHQLNEEVTTHMDAYNIPDALSPVLPFIDDASNWFVRRSRRRFWKSEDDGDKSDAYRTLHYVLLKLSVILAPFTPFLAEELYQKLGGGNESVHLLNWPTNYSVDEIVMNEMAATRKIIEIGLMQRMKRDDEFGQIKIRQPLAELTYGGVELSEFYETIIAEEVNVKKVSSGFMTNEKHGAVYVVLDKALTPELQREGYAREVVRHVQAARKAAGFNV